VSGEDAGPASSKESNQFVRFLLLSSNIAFVSGRGGDSATGFLPAMIWEE
jgi:hypothetical protein